MFIIITIIIITSIQANTAKKPKKVPEVVVVPSASEMHPYQNSPLINNNDATSKLNISLISVVPYDNDLLVSSDLIDEENDDNENDDDDNNKRLRYDDDNDNDGDNDNDQKRQRYDDEDNNTSTPSYNDDKSRDILLPLDNIDTSILSSQNINNTTNHNNTQLSSIDNDISNENVDLNSSIRSNTSIDCSQISEEAVKGGSPAIDDPSTYSIL